jgi:glycosyltransferase involved in cell wall biosynthesis
VGGIPEIVDHGVNGLLVRPGDARELAKAIKLLLDEELWSRLSYNARKKAEEKYSIRNIGRMYEETYIEALEKNKVQN